MIRPSDFLVEDAYQRVWCGPGQDRQHRVGPARFSRAYGEIGTVKIGMRQYALPTQGDRYHCFMIGDLPPVLVGMDTIPNKWVSVRAHCINTSLLIDLYTVKGKHIPTHRAYFLYTSSGALVLVILETPKVGKLGVEQPYIRWRSGLAMENSSVIPRDKGIEIEGITFTDSNAFYIFQAKWRTAVEGLGHAWAFVNGMKVKDINQVTAKVGDVLEYVRDASVKEVVEIPVKTLLAFSSILDNRKKYLLPRPGLGTVIDYCDDIDIYLLNYHLPAAYTGYYFHCNNPDAVRMVTHRDYAIAAGYLDKYVEDDPLWTWTQDLRVELIIRESGNDKLIPDEAHRIQDLFRLPEPKRLRAMIGEKSIDVWKAENLENSFYTKIMGVDSGLMVRGDVEKAYGYNAISKILNDTPIKVNVGTDKWVRLPVGTWDRSTVYEYNAAGLLLGWYLHDCAFEYPVRNASTKYVEAFNGYGGVGSSTDFDKNGTIIEADTDYRFYLSRIANGVHLNDWVDVTGNTSRYQVVNGAVVWTVDRTKFSTAVRSSKDFLAYGLDLNYRDDLLAFSITATEIRSGRTPETGVMDIPFGQYNLWLNQHELVPGIDYYENFPEFCIVNKAYLVPGPVQHVDIRGRSFCTTDMKLRPPAETGFVAYGKLSYNARYNVREDQVNHVCIEGGIYTREELGFVEDGQLIPGNVPNGVPYMVQHPVISMMGVTDTDTYTMLAEAQVIDKEVEDYLTVELPQPVEPQPNPISYWWQVFSPFTTKLMYDMLNGLLPMDEFKGEYSDEVLRKRLSGYDWILKYDPALMETDDDYVIIQPHPETGVIELNIYQYRLLDRAIRLFLKNRVTLDRHMVIVEEGFEHDQRDHPHPHRTWESVGLS